MGSQFRKGVFLLVFLVLIQVSLVSAAVTDSLTGNVDNLSENVEFVDDLVNNDEAREEYLRQEWDSLLEDTFLGKFLSSFKIVMTSIDFFWKAILGLAFSWSWLFFLALFIWITLLRDSNKLLTFFEPWFIKYGKSLKAIFLVLVLVIISATRVSRLIADWIIGLIKGDIFMQVILIVLVFGIIIFLSMLAKNFEKMFVGLKRAREKKLMKEDVSEEKEDVEDIKKYLREEAEDDLEDLEAEEPLPEDVDEDANPFEGMGDPDNR